MKYPSLIIAFSIIAMSSVCSQTLSQTNKIIFQYNIGHYRFQSAGEYEKIEILEFIPIKNGRFRRKTLSIKNSYVFNPKTQLNDIRVADSTWKIDNVKFTIDMFQRFINQLNSNKENFDFANMKDYLTPISKKDIITVAKSINKFYYFTDEDDKKIDKAGREKIKEIKNFVKIDSFILAFKPKIEDDLVVVDDWNNLEISFIEQNDTITYRFQFFSLLGQPYNKQINTNYDKTEKFINVVVNHDIQKFLPRKSIIKNAVSYNRLNEAYIKWYIKTKIWD